MGEAHSKPNQRDQLAELPVPDGDVRVDSMAHMPRVLRELGLDPDDLLEEASLDAHVFENWLNYIPIAKVGRLLALAVAASGCDDIGLRVGAPAQPPSLGLVAALASTSPSVGTALRNLDAHLHLRDRAGVAPFVVDGDVATLGYEVYQPDIEAVDQICDGSIAMGVNILRDLCGPEWRALEVMFAHRKPSDLRLFRRFFDAPLRFDAERTAIVFESRWLERRAQNADDESFSAFMYRVLKAESQSRGDLVIELRRMLRANLLTGNVSVSDMAEQLSLHRRTLNRRLRAQGTSLHHLIEDARFEMSRQLIENTKMQLTEIAAAAGYADSSAFTRAFLRWTGMTPSAWRKQASASLSRTAKPGGAASPRIVAKRA